MVVTIENLKNFRELIKSLGYESEEEFIKEAVEEKNH